MQKNFNLQALNTLQVPCTAKLFTEVESTYQLLQLLETPEWKNEKHWILWWGSNTLFTTDFFDGIIVKLQIKGIKILKETDETIEVQVGAGEIRDNFVKHCIENQWWGIENLISIPGNVGTSAVSNIWAYGQEACEAISEVIGVHLESNTLQKLSNEECDFGYRKSIFKTELKDRFIITHIVFKLKKISQHYDFNTQYADIQKAFSEQWIVFETLNPAKKLEMLTTVIVKIRKDKLPDWKTVWTAGSYFKNPKVWLPQWEKLHKQFPDLKGFLQDDETMKLSAGQLIELCGFKGHKEGKVKISEQHALILINEWGNWAEVKAFAEKIQKSVFKKFWVQIEPEVIYCD